jgi:hypothetical protein
MRRFVATMSAGFALLVSAAVLAAVDTGGHPAACKPMSQADSTHLSFSSDAVYNFGASPATITCGAVRLSSASPAILYVDYVDNSTSGQISCGVRIWHWNNKSSLWSQTKTTGLATVGANALRFSLPSSIAGYVELQCSIPAVAGGASLIRGFNLQ